MDLLEGFLTALDSLATNRLRAALTMLGIIIGVAAVIALLAVGKGVSKSIQSEIQEIGSNLITIITDYGHSGGYPTLSMQDAAMIENRSYVPAVIQVAAEIQGTQQVFYGGRGIRVTVAGITANDFSVRNKSIKFGKGLTQDDINNQARVAVLGADVVEDLFPDGEFPIDVSVKIGGIQYKVIGVLERQGGVGMTGQDDRVFIPLTTAQNRLYSRRTRNGERKVDVIFAVAADEGRIDEATNQIKRVLRNRHDIVYRAEDDFRIVSQTDILDAFGAITDSLNLFLGTIAGISLLVGGIGIMNIMLVSVTERTKEIGIRKAVGALRRDILVQFLIESLLLSLIGGLFGIVLGMVASNVIGNLSPNLVPVVDTGTVLMSFGVSAAVGLTFGIYPAWRAARLRPIDALRYE